MEITIITPASGDFPNGNRITALRWKKILQRLGHRITLAQKYSGWACDLMVALHARRSSLSIRKFYELRPDRPLIVALTGTDLYRDIRTHGNARKSLEMATRLIVLQEMALNELPKRLHPKTRVIYQSATRVEGTPSNRNGFQVCVVGHLRPEKDPLRTARAVRELPDNSKISVVHIGRALDAALAKRAATENKTNPRYRWLGELPHSQTRGVLARSRLLSLTSRIEGACNVLSEALASSVPVVASRISGLIGTLGKDYPGYFPVGDTRALARKLQQAESNPLFYRELKERCRQSAKLVDPQREVAHWRALVDEVG